MFELAKRQTLYVEKLVEFGAYLVPLELKEKKVPEKNEHVLLPKKFVPEGAKRGDGIEVFLYLDSSDRMIATTLMPLVTLGEVARLRVKEVSKIGAFLDWDLKRICSYPLKSRPKRWKQETIVLLVFILINREESHLP